MVSHQEVLNLLHREADNMAGYGYGYECPHCEGSGLIGGRVPGQRSFMEQLNQLPIGSIGQYKTLMKNLRAKYPTAPKTAERRKAIAQAIVDRDGALLPAKPKAKRWTKDVFDAAIRELGYEFKQ